MENNQAADIETHKRLLFAITEYLHSLGEGDLALKYGFQVDNISIAADLLSHVSGLSLENPEHVQKYSVKPMSLTNIFGLGLARKEQLEQAIGQLNKAEQAPQVAAPKRQEYGFNDPNLEEKFRAYLELIRSRGYFNGVEENTPAYQERVENAKKRFAARYAQENPQESASQSATPVNAATPVSETPVTPLSDAERLKQAEQHKTEGNERLANKKFQEAIVSYSKAIELNKTNAIYYSNRAAAYSHIGQHHKAIEDCKQAIAIDPLYVKAYSRLGLAYFSLGKYKEAVEQGYKKALEIEPTNTAIRESLSAAEAKIRELQNVTPVPNMGGMGGMGGMPAMPNMGGMGGMPNMGGMPGANPAGGMPDIGAMFNNPGFQNAFQNFAQNLGQGGAGGLAGMLNNPAIQQMMNSPQVMQMMNNPQMMNTVMQQMMNNPQIMDIAQNLAQNPDVQQMLNQQGNPNPNPDTQQ